MISGLEDLTGYSGPVGKTLTSAIWSTKRRTNAPSSGRTATTMKSAFSPTYNSTTANSHM
ncbi:hypothetical protein EMPG_12834 [Blastomyces silverae]|uniref:Uncharacterized protein n=1 Tax=Blastomyces silverae TaxID=2060906 RepID=A0A0H1BLM6_9EURO|nr:hypothetical protein EMPG_12834 [Blastomyces silverae]